MTNRKNRNKEAGSGGTHKTVIAVSSVLLATAVAICLYVMIQILAFGYASIGGYSLFRVVTGSMEPAIPTGAVIVAEKTQIDQILEGDIICYRSNSAQTKGWIITHRVVAVGSDDEEILLITKGDANTAADAGQVYERDLIGRVVWYSKRGNPVMSVISVLTSETGFMAFILLPCLLIAGLTVSHSINSIRKELDALAQQEKQSQQDAQKNAALKAQLAAWGITPEEYAQLREKILRELLAEREIMMQTLRKEMSKDLKLGEKYEDGEIHGSLKMGQDHEQAKNASEKTQ